MLDPTNRTRTTRSILPLAALVAACAVGACTSTPPSNSPHPEGGHGEPGKPEEGQGKPEDQPKVDPPTPEEAKTFAQASNAFGVDLWKAIAKKPGNLTVSPASISMAFAMPYIGARGATADEMKKVLHFGGTPEETATAAGKLSAELTDPKRKLVFRIANQLYGEQSAPFEQPFLDLTASAFGAPMAKVDFKGNFEGVRTNINDWVAKKTENKITGLMPQGSLDDLTRLVIVNALYFKGDWEEAFDKGATSPGAFTTPGGEKQTPMMHGDHDARHGYAAVDGVKVLSMDYKGGAMSMLFILPDAKDGLPAVEKSLTTAKLDGFVGALSRKPVEVTLPKFEINPAESLPLGPTLVGMGMKIAFDDRAADFTGISNPSERDERLHIDKVFHKAFIKLDETGTEAAAATGIGMAATTSVAPPSEQFVADHPFLFVLRDNASGLTIFMGRIDDPTQTK